MKWRNLSRWAASDEATNDAYAVQIERLAEQLRSAGLRPGDCVVMVLPKGKKDALVTRREFLERAIATTER